AGARAHVDLSRRDDAPRAEDRRQAQRRAPGLRPDRHVLLSRSPSRLRSAGDLLRPARRRRSLDHLPRRRDPARGDLSGVPVVPLLQSGASGLRVEVLLTGHNAPGLPADEALSRLIEGNARFVRGEARFPTVQKEILADLAKGQQPYATILGCSDSRVPPELVF